MARPTALIRKIEDELLRRSFATRIAQARHNENRQRAREEAGLDVRVSSSFWEQVGRDLRQAQAKTKEK